MPRNRIWQAKTTECPPHWFRFFHSYMKAATTAWIQNRQSTVFVSQSGDLADSNRTVCLGRTGLNCDFTSPNNARQCQVVGNQGYTYNIFQEQRECHTATKMPFMYFSSGNCMASVPVSTFMCLWAIYTVYSQDRSTCFLQKNRQIDFLWEYINRSKTHECGNWYCGREIPFLRIFIPFLVRFVSNFRRWFSALHLSTECVNFFLYLV
jgi:hypothetical protein